MARLNLSSPWVLFYHEVEAFFKGDSDVCVIFDDEKMELRLYVSMVDKAEAIAELMPESKTYGSTELKIVVVPPNENKYNSYISRSMTLLKNNPMMLFNVALAGNNAFDYVKEVSGVFSNPLYYVVFRKEVVQYFTDDLGDINGVRSTLYQEIAKDIFKSFDNVYYCTNTTSMYDHVSIADCRC